MHRIFVALLTLSLSSGLLAAQAATSISVVPSGFDFGDVEVSTSSPSEVLTITNTGTSDLHISGFNLTDGANFVEFGDCPVLAPLATCELQVAFSPTKLGKITATFSVHSDAPAGVVSVPLSGYGTFPATNDQIASAETMSPSFASTYTTKNAAGAPTDPDPQPIACESGVDSRNHTVWYRFLPPADGWLQLDTHDSDYDTVLSIWDGTPGALTFNACDDDEISGLMKTSKLVLPVSSTKQYFIMVGGKTATATGILTLHSTFQTSQAIKQQEVVSGSANAGQSASFGVIAQFDGPTNVTFAISPATSTINCTATPSSLPFMGAGSSRFAMVNTTCKTQGPSAAVVSPTVPPWETPLFGACCFGFCLLGWRNRRMRAVLAVLFVAIGTSCGGGGSKSASLPAPAPPPPTQSISTPSGTYTITLVGSPKPITSTPMMLAVK